MTFILVSFVVLTIYKINGYVPVNNKMKSFTSALKNAHFNSNEEMTVYENMNGPGVITELWFTTGDFNENTTLRVYVDDDYITNKSSIECKLYMCHSIGFIGNKQHEGQYVPWSTKRIGHQAFDGGLYNTIRIPFGKQIRITLWQNTAATFWFMARGVLNYPLVLGDLLLPANSRLRLYKNEDVLLQPYEMLTLANISGTAGAVLQIFMAAQATDFPYIEGCYRVKIDNDTTINGHEYQFLSSGVEDMYLSGFAFDKGVYHGDNSGCTYISGGIYDHESTSNITFSAYKFFENDPLLFTSSISLLWKCGSNGDCPTTWPPNQGEKEQKKKDFKADQSTKVTTYTWIYTYDLS
eukprot:207302_1